MTRTQTRLKRANKTTRRTTGAVGGSLRYSRLSESSGNGVTIMLVFRYDPASSAFCQTTMDAFSRSGAALFTLRQGWNGPCPHHTQPVQSSMGHVRFRFLGIISGFVVFLKG